MFLLQPNVLHLRVRRALSSATTALLLLGLAPGALANEPDLRIDSFGATQPVVFGSDTITMVGTIRNVGNAASAQGAAFARMHCLTGLAYVEGDTIPLLPALAPGASVTYRWKVRPDDPDGPLVASLTVMPQGKPQVVQVIPIPHLNHRPSNAGAPTPGAYAKGGHDALLQNNRIRIKVWRNGGTPPILQLSVRSGGGWRQVGMVSPVAEVLSAEGGQHPWWELFRAERITASSSPTRSQLTLTGGFGLRWRATVVLSLAAGSGAVEARFSFSPIRKVKLHGIRICTLLSGDAARGAANADKLDPEPSDENVVTAFHWNGTTVGLLRPDAPPMREWTWHPIPDITGADYHISGAEARTPGGPVDMEIDGLVETRARVFALTPSTSVTDAKKMRFSDPVVRIATTPSAKTVSRGGKSHRITANHRPTAKPRSHSRRRR